MVEPNQYINTAMRHVRHPALAGNGDWRDEAAHALDTARATPWGAQTLAGEPRLTHWLDRLRSRDEFSDVDRVRCLRDLEEVAHSRACDEPHPPAGHRPLHDPRAADDSVAFTPEHEISTTR